MTILDHRSPALVVLSGPSRAPLSHTEGRALALVAGVTTVFAVYGTMTGVASTAAYVVVVAAVTTLVAALRRNPLPGPLAGALAALAVAHLAGGLVSVGHGVLYNASYRTEVLQYDHLVHSSASFVATLVVWTVFAPLGAGAGSRRWEMVPVWVLAGLGLGAVNELVEFLATLAHSGGAVGGYDNTGWDLVSNFLGAAAAGITIAARARQQRA